MDRRFPFQIRFIAIDSNLAPRKSQAATRVRCNLRQAVKRVNNHLNKQGVSVDELKELKHRVSNEPSLLQDIELYILFIKNRVRTIWEGLCEKDIAKYGKNIFLRRNIALAQLSKLGKVDKRANSYFFPNTILTQSSSGIFSKPFHRPLESLDQELIVSQLNFFFLDIDSDLSDEGLDSFIARLPIEPDVQVRSSGKRTHLYWSIRPVHLSYCKISNNRTRRFPVIRTTPERLAATITVSLSDFQVFLL